VLGRVAEEPVGLGDDLGPQLGLLEELLPLEAVIVPEFDRAGVEGVAAAGQAEQAGQ
jgi:hypothetical protein